MGSAGTNRGKVVSAKKSLKNAEAQPARLEGTAGSPGEGSHLAAFERVKVEDGDHSLLAFLGALRHRHELVVGAHRHRSDAFSVLRPWNKLLGLLLGVEDDNVVAGRVDDGLLVEVAQIVLDVRFYAKCVACSHRGPGQTQMIAVECTAAGGRQGKLREE